MEDSQPCHRVTFERQPVFRPKTCELLIFIDGVDLREMVRQAEIDMTQVERPAGESGYSGIHWRESEDPLGLLRHYLGAPDPYYAYGSRTQILGCTCGEPGCWPLLCRIDVTPRRVQWSDFRQAHKMGQTRTMTTKSGTRTWTVDHWEYGGFGPFLFERSQFEEALLTALR